jgi:hypothetical protein
MTRFSSILTSTFAIVSFVAVSPSYAQAPAPAPAPAAQHQDHQPTPASAAQGHDMMAMHKKMMGDMTAMDTRLDELVARMNSATGVARTDAIAEVVTAMVQQHKAMRTHMAEMHDHMMQMMPMDNTAKPMGGRMGGPATR